MADTKVQLEVEKWIRATWLAQEFGEPFKSRAMLLTSGGKYVFDAVNHDGSVVANVSTCRLAMASGKPGVGKMMKVRSDVYFLLLSTAARKLMLLTELDMHARWVAEQASGRVPVGIEFRHVQLPPELASVLAIARLRSSREVTPRQP